MARRLFSLMMLLMSVFSTDSGPVVSTTSGALEGVEETVPAGKVIKFLGIPYGQPPVGDLRFKPPQPLDENARKAHLNASKFAAACMQWNPMKELTPPDLLVEDQKYDEDCLYLNVFVPQSQEQTSGGYFGIRSMAKKVISFFHREEPLPIMVWIPGGGFSFASSNPYDVSSLALNGNVIVMTLNYRVSVFGFLSTGDDEIPGNMGLLDQLAAIRWIKANAEAFGGNPQSITVFGQFTGAMSISALLTSPLSMPEGTPLFEKAILQSGIAAEQWSIEYNPKASFATLAKNSECAPDGSTIPEQVDCLRKVSAQNLLGVSGFGWRPVIEKDTMPDEPLHVLQKGQKYLQIPVILGSTNYEGSLCFLTHYAMKTAFLSKITEDKMTEDDFIALVKAFYAEYLGDKANDEMIDYAIKQYGNRAGKSWRDRYMDFCGDGYIRNKTRLFAKELSQHGTPVYLYKFSQRPSKSIHPPFIDAGHGDDVLFSLGIVQQTEGWTDEEIELSKSITKAWAKFAKDGNPNPMAGSKEEWPRYFVDHKQYWEFSIDPSSGVKSTEYLAA